MKNRAYFLAALSLLSVSVISYGQINANTASGLLFTRSELNPTKLFNLSETGSLFATARTTSMGGAFTSLGADVSSMHINPAGLGMYQTSEFSFTPMFTRTNISSTNKDGYIANGSNNKNRFTLGNAGIAMNFYEGTGALTSFTFGFGVNRMADFNTTNYMDLGSKKNVSIAKAFKYQLDGYTEKELDNRDFDYFPDNRWGAVMAWDTFLLDTLDRSANIYTVTGGIGDETDVEHRLVNKTRGSIMEYNISGGFNFQNKVYFGFSLGMVDYNYKQHVYYAEDYHNNNSSADYQTRYLDYDQYVKITGAGVNVKLGLIYRPIDALRLGFAFHSPTWIKITDRYEAGMHVEFENKGYSQSTLILTDDFRFGTPPKIMGGISYTFGTMGVISADYERVWYNSMRSRDDGLYFSDLNSWVKEEFKASNVFRIGGELRATDLLSLRAGYAYATSPGAIDERYSIYDSPVRKNYYNISGGIGYRIGRHATLDVAYVFNRTNYHDYYVVQNDYVNGPEEDYFKIGNPVQKLKRHTVLATLGVRF